MARIFTKVLAATAGVATVAALAGVHLGSKEAPTTAAAKPDNTSILVLTDAQAKRLYGTSDRNGTNSPDAYTIEWDDATNIAWAPIFTDESYLLPAGPATDLSKPAAGKPSGDIALRESRYSKVQIEGALAEAVRISETNRLSAAMSYSPAADAVVIFGEAGGKERFGSTLGGVEVVFHEGEISRG